MSTGYHGFPRNSGPVRSNLLLRTKYSAARTTPARFRTSLLRHRSPGTASREIRCFPPEPAAAAQIPAHTVSIPRKPGNYNPFSAAAALQPPRFIHGKSNSVKTGANVPQAGIGTARAEKISVRMEAGPCGPRSENRAEPALRFRRAGGKTVLRNSGRRPGSLPFPDRFVAPRSRAENGTAGERRKKNGHAAFKENRRPFLPPADPEMPSPARFLPSPGLSVRARTEISPAPVSA